MKEHPELVAMFEERRRLLDEQLERKMAGCVCSGLKTA